MERLPKPPDSLFTYSRLDKPRCKAVDTDVGGDHHRLVSTGQVGFVDDPPGPPTVGGESIPSGRGRDLNPAVSAQDADYASDWPDAIQDNPPPPQRPQDLQRPPALSHPAPLVTDHTTHNRFHSSHM